MIALIKSREIDCPCSRKILCSFARNISARFYQAGVDAGVKNPGLSLQE